MRHAVRPAFLLMSAVLALTSVPLAAASAQTRSIRVHSFDLDLATGNGQAELQRRVQRAVDQVCGPATGANLDNIASYASCKKAAEASATVQLEAMVKAAYEHKVATGPDGDVIVR